MNVVLSVESLRPPLTGIGRYTLSLLRGLLAHPDIDEVRCFLETRWVDATALAAAAGGAGASLGVAGHSASASAVPRAGAVALPARGPGWRRRLIEIAREAPGAYPLRAWLRDVSFARACRGLAPAVYHEPNFVLKPYAGPAVVTVHDLSHLRYAAFHPGARVAYLNRSLPRTLRRAQRVITDAAFVRDELIAETGVAPERVVAIPLGVDPVFAPAPAQRTAPALARFGLQPGRYLLSVATFEPRKNLAGLVEAFSRLEPRLRREYPLALAGARGWKSGGLEAKLQALVAAGEARMIGYVPEADLPFLYAGATAFAFLSFYEGFGLPVLEAMASGAPVIASNRSTLPEVAGEAALLVDPEDIDGIAAGLSRLLEDSSLRATLSAAGAARAREFTWERCVERTVGVYRAAQGESR